MEIRITGWGYENIRRLNTLDVDLLSNGEGLPHTTLVMMKNGTGKTTTHQLMRATLSGNADKWSEEKVKEFKPIDSDKSIGKFYVKMKFGDEPYRYSLIFDYNLGKARYETSRVRLSGGLENGHTLPASMRHVLNSDGFVERFIFDGEQAKKTLNADSKEAQYALEYLYQIDKLWNLKQRIENLMQEKQSESESKGATSISRKNNKTRRDNKKKQYDILSKKHGDLKNDIKRLEEQQATLMAQRQKLVDSDDALKKQQQELNAKKILQENNLVDALQTIGKNIRYPFNICEEFDKRLIELAENMQTLKLPKTTAREFFKELAMSKDCICGRKIGSAEKAIILQRAELYLGAEDLSAINAIKDKLRNYSKTSELADARTEMINTKERVNETQNALNRLMMQLNDDDIEKSDEIQKELDILNNDIHIKKSELAELEASAGSPKASEQNNLQLAKKAYEDAEQNYQRILGTYEYTQRAETLIKYIDMTEKRTLENLKIGIVQKTNEKIAEILPDDPIKIGKIDGSLVLDGRSGASEGQTLAIAYSYIGSLFAHSSYEFPFVIDSPAASMDLDVRREVATIIPKLFKQLIIFVTSGEVAGFAKKFYSKYGIKYLTIEGQNDGESAVCTEGQAYFATYQSEED